MNRTLLLSLILLALGGLTTWMVLRAGGGDLTTVSGADRAFKVEDADRIGKVFIADRKDNQSTLVRQANGGWVYNDQYPVNERVIANLLDAITRIEMDFKPANAAVPNMIRSLATDGIKVEIYDRSEQLIKAYYIGGSTPDERGTYMIMDGYDQPYVVSIPGWTGNVRFRYNLLGDEWRTKVLFHTPAEQIAGVSVEYPKQRSLSFSLSREGQDFRVEPFYNTTPAAGRPPKNGMINAYLVNFDNLSLNRYVNADESRSRLQSELPFAIITLATTAQDTQRVKLYPRFLDPATTAEPGTVPSGAALDGYYGLTEADDLILLQERVIN